MNTNLIIFLHVILWLFIGVAVMMTIKSTRPECKALEIIMLGMMWPAVFFFVGVFYIVAIFADWVNWRKNRRRHMQGRRRF